VDIALVCVADVLVGLSFGAISVSGGLSPWVPVLMSLVVFAGGAQFAAVGAVLAGGSPAAGLLAGLVLNARLLPFAVAVAVLAVLVLAAGTYALRLLGPVLRHRLRVPDHVERLLGDAATVLLVAAVLAVRRAPFPVVVLAAAGTTAVLRLLGAR
jgi:AzlC protein